MKKPEILALRKHSPETFKRVIEMERRAMVGEGQAPASRCGLGRNFSWGDFVARADADLTLPSDAGTPEIDCGCYDG